MRFTVELVCKSDYLDRKITYLQFGVTFLPLGSLTEWIRSNIYCISHLVEQKLSIGKINKECVRLRLT